ncbi:hypothetical protein [Dysgonomonas sp. 520]|uniref:hypothetical protein n=1 Tax=Dysgonomonas sp. 520 TaxID=2302931 RepID=UPI0013D22080|nr:hypothetical protein [Dysgonomonas sp. 520]NDW08654.1 hypothetical protein [Dysgonomonas sp. 520]
MDINKLKKTHIIIFSLLFIFTACSENEFIKLNENNYEVRSDSTLLVRVEPRSNAEVIREVKYGPFISLNKDSYYTDWVEVYVKDYPNIVFTDAPQIDSIRGFIDKRSFQANAVRSLSSYSSDPIFYTKANKNSKCYSDSELRNMDVLSFNVAGDIDNKEWIPVEVSGWKRNRSGNLTPETFHNLLYVHRDQFKDGTISFYASHMYTKHSIISYYWDSIWYDANRIFRGQYFFDFHLSWWRSIPIIVLVLLIINILAIFLSSIPKLQVFVEYITLLGAFGFEFIYIFLLGENFWFCNPDTMGWFKATLFFIPTISLLVLQYYRFLNLLQHIQQFTRPISTFMGVSFFKYWIILFFVIAIICGGDPPNDLASICVIGIGVIQIIQFVVTLIQLRHTPLVALGTAIIIPLGMLAVIFCFLSILGTALLFAIVGLIIYGVAVAKGGNASIDNGYGPAGHCPHFNTPFCDFIEGGRSECSLHKGQGCKHGQV